MLQQTRIVRSKSFPNSPNWAQCVLAELMGALTGVVIADWVQRLKLRSDCLVAEIKHLNA